MAKLAVSIQNLKTFKNVDKSLFERFYFGYPYCLEKAGSFLIEPDHLKQAITEIKKLGKEAFLITPAVLQNKELGLVESAIEQAVKWGLDGIEVNDVAMFAVAKKWPNLKVLAGFFVNVYNPQAALEYIKEGATTVLAHPELMYEEIKEIADYVKSQISNTLTGTVPRPSEWGLSPNVEIAVYGNLPLGAAYDCYLKTVDSERVCHQQCTKPYYFKHQMSNVKSNAEFAMRSVGKANLMANEFCLLEHIDQLKTLNANYWRLETSLYESVKINTIGKAFFECNKGANPAGYIRNIKLLAPNGLCDGWFLGKSGHSYTGSQQKVAI